jgi:hypothetical protein
MEYERIKIYQGLKADGETELEFDAFKNKFFKSEKETARFYQMLVSAQDPKGVFYYNDTIQNFFKKYACDLFPNSTYCGGSGSTTTTTGTSKFACVEAVHTSRRAYNSDKSQLHITRTNGTKHVFFNTGTFIYLDGSTKIKGKWGCDGTNKYKITLTNGQKYSLKDDKWSSVPKTPPPTPEIDRQQTRTNSIRLTDVKNGTKSVKIGAKGSIVTKIQDLLIGLGYNDVSNSGKSDGNFGPKTDGMVKKYQKDNDLKDDGIVGSKTITALLGGKSDATKVEPAVTATQPDSIQGTDGVIIKEKEKLDILQESVKKLLRKSLLGFRKK